MQAGGASAWACLWLVALLHVRGSWSSCVFVRSTVLAFWGHALLSAWIPPSLSFTVLACSTSGSGRGSWLLQVQANLVALCVLPFFRTGCQSQARGWGVSLFSARFDRVMVLAVRVCVVLRLQLFLRMRLRLLYLCLRAWPPCCRKCRWCCCLSRCVGVGQGPRSPPAFCRAGHRAPGGKLHVSLCRCSAFALRANASL